MTSSGLAKGENNRTKVLSTGCNTASPSSLRGNNEPTPEQKMSRPQLPGCFCHSTGQGGSFPGPFVVLPEAKEPKAYLPFFCTSIFCYHSSLWCEQHPEDEKASINNTNILLVNVAFPHTTPYALFQSSMNL